LEYDYNISDVLIPLKGMRHLPKIVRIKDPFIRYYEAAGNAIMTAAQITLYYSLYELLKN
jgi:hypothetical protein